MTWKVAFAVLAAVLAVGFGAMVGGWSDVEEKDCKEICSDVLTFAAVDHNRRTNDLFRTEMVNVVKIQKQVVAGMKYKITATMLRTSCRKDGTEENCQAHPQAQPYNCTFTVLSKPWQNLLQVLDKTCDN